MSDNRKYTEKGKTVEVCSSLSPDFEYLLKINNRVILYLDAYNGEEGNFAIALYHKGEKIHGIVSNEYGWRRTALGVRIVRAYSVHYSEAREEVVELVHLGPDIYAYKKKEGEK